jgi:lipopolysaccharide export LptBFGC system permease protein LptF
MLYTLHSYISRELAKVFAIAALSLTLVLALCGLLQPLRSQGVSAMQLFQYLFYFIPVTMTFSLPVAALLAATLVYGRLSADNELIACRASGIGMWTLIMPGIALGVFVMISNLLLSNWFIPICAQKATLTIKGDIQDIAFNKLRVDRQLIWKGVVVTTAHVERQADGGIRLIRPTFTLAGRRKEDRLEKIICCREALIWFDREAGTITVRPKDAVGMLWHSGDATARAEDLPFSRPVPQLTRDSVSFKTYGELLALRAFPEAYFRVKGKLDPCRRAVAQKMLYEDIREALESAARSYEMRYEMEAGETLFQPGLRPADGGRIEPATEVVRPLGDAVVWAASAQPRKQDDPTAGLVLGRGWPDGPHASSGLPRRPRPSVVITLIRPARPGQAEPMCVRYRAGKAELKVVLREEESVPRVAVQFGPDYWSSEEPVSVDPLCEWRPGEVHHTTQEKIERLLPVSRLADRVGALGREQIESALPASSDLRKNLRASVDQLRRDIVAELHSRGAFSVAGLVLVVLGAALGVIFRSGHVLVAFGLAAVPAIFAMIMVVMGNQLATNNRSSLQPLGLAFIWSGNVLTVVLNVWVYARMLKH